MADGEIILGVDIDVRQAEEKIQRLIKTLSKLKIEDSNISPKLREIAKETELCEQHILRLKNALRNANDSTVIDKINKEIKVNEQYLETLVDEYSKLLTKKLEIKEAIKEINKEIGNIRKEKIDALEESHRRAEQAARKHAQAESMLRTSLSKIISLPPIQFVGNNILKPALNGLKTFGRTFGEFTDPLFAPLFEPIYQRCLPALQNLGKGFSWVKDRLSGLGQGFSWIKGHFVNASNSINSVSRTFQNFGGGISRVFSTLSNFGSQALGWISRLTSRIFYLASSAFVFNVISAGFRSLSKELRNLIAQDAELVMWLNNVKANLMTAFYPIYQAALPALRALGQMLSWITAQLAQFIAMLTGTSVSANQQGAKQMYMRSALSNSGNTRAYKAHTKSQARANKVKSSNAAKVSKSVIKTAGTQKDDIGKSVSQAYNSAGKSAEDNAKKLAKFDKAATKSRKELAKFDKIDILKQDKEKSLKEIIPKTPKVSMPKEPKLAEVPDVTPFIPNMPVLDGFKQNLESIQLSPFFDNILKWFERLKEPLKNISFENLNRELGNLWNSISKFGGTIGEGLLWFYDNVLVPLAKWTIEDLLPDFLKVLTSCLDALDPIAKEVGNQLADLWDKFLKHIVGFVADGLTDFLELLSDLISDLGDEIKNNKFELEFLSAFLIGLGSVLTINAIAKLTSKIWALVAANWAWVASLLANPTTWLVIAIAALIAIIILCIKHWDKIKKAMEDFWDKAKEIWDKIKEWIYDKFDKAKKWVEKKFQEIGEASGKMWEAMKNAAKQPLNWLLEKTEFLLNKIIGGLNWFIEQANKIGFDLPDWAGGGHFGINISKIQEVKIPRLAKGSVLKGGDPFLAWVNDQPRGQTNVEAPLDTIVKAFKEAAGNNGNQNIVIEANGDLGGIIRELNFRLKNENRRIGTEIMVPSGVL